MNIKEVMKKLNKNVQFPEFCNYLDNDSLIRFLLPELLKLRMRLMFDGQWDLNKENMVLSLLSDNDKKLFNAYNTVNKCLYPQDLNVFSLKRNG